MRIPKPEPIPDNVPGGYEPTRWWHVLDSEGGLWLETSDKEEALRHMRLGDVLERLYSKTTAVWVRHDS